MSEILTGCESIQENLTCKTATLINVNSQATEGIIGSLPLVTLDVSCLLGLETIGGWYQVIGDGNIFTMTACSLDISKSVGISVFTGDCSELECIERQSRQIVDCENGNGRAISFASKPGTPYTILVSGLPIGADLLSSFDISSGSSFDSLLVRRLQEPKLEIDFRLEFAGSAAPNNSKCGTSLPITFGIPVEGSTMGLLTTNKTCQDSEKAGAWYSVAGSVPTEDGVIVYKADTCSFDSNFYHMMSVYRGDRCGSHECVDVDVLPCPNGSSGQQVYWSTSLQENYQIFVHSSDTIEASAFDAGSFPINILDHSFDAIEASFYDAGSFHINVAYHSRLANDQCNSALEFELNRDGTVMGKTSGSTPDINSIANSSCGAGGSGAWYHFTGTGAIYQASTCSNETDHETGIQVYSGECGRLTCIDSGYGNKAKAICNDGKASFVNFKTIADIDYYILVTSRESKTGNFGLQVTEIQPPENNECSAAIAIPLEESVASLGSTRQATIDFPGGYYCGVPLEAPGVWYEIEGTGRGMGISICHADDFDSAISVFKGSSCGNLECVTGSSAINSMCTYGRGADASFFGDEYTKYHVYVHGKAGFPSNTGDFTISYSEFGILEVNEFCPLAHSVPTNGNRVQGSTEDATHASVPSSTCGVPITNPGLWYTFQGNGKSFEISACSKDEGSFDVSVSVFAGGPGEGCESLTCLTGTTYLETVCSSAQGQRTLQGGSLSGAFRLMTENNQDYYIFVHGTGTEGVGDFDLYVLDENLAGSMTASPTETPVRYGKDLYRWVPVNATEAISIATDYLALDILDPPFGNATLQGFIIQYVPLLDFSGDDIMTVQGCNERECYRFDVTINVMGKKTKIDPSAKEAGDEGWNKMWLFLLLMLPLIPCGCLCYYISCQNKQQDDFDIDQNDGDTSNNNDTFDQDEEGSLLHHRGPDSNADVEDWEFSEIKGEVP